MEKKTSINLLPVEMRFGAPWAKLKILLSRGSFMVLGIYLFILLAFSGAYFFVLREKNALSYQEKTLISEIADFKNEERLLQIVRDRLKLAKGVFAAGASSPGFLVEKVISLAPSSVEIFSVVAKEGEVTLSSGAPDSFVLSSFIERLRESDLTVVILDGISFNGSQGGGYSVSVQIK